MHSVANLATLQTPLETFFPSKKCPNLVSENHRYCRANARSCSPSARTHLSLSLSASALFSAHTPLSLSLSASALFSAHTPLSLSLCVCSVQRAHTSLSLSLRLLCSERAHLSLSLSLFLSLCVCSARGRERSSALIQLNTDIMLLL